MITKMNLRLNRTAFKREEGYSKNDR